MNLLLWLHRLGLLGVWVGVSVFAFAGTWADYRLTSSSLRALQDTIKAEHWSVLEAELQPLENQWFDSVTDFVSEVRARVRTASGKLPRGAAIWESDEIAYVTATVREASVGRVPSQPFLFFLLSFGLASLGSVLSFVPRLQHPEGIQNHGIMFSQTKSRGLPGIAIGLGLIGFYVALYFYPEYIVNWTRLTDPLSQLMRSAPADRWFFYGTLYTFAVVVMGVRMLFNYRHNRYHVVRTLSVIFFQLGFAFVLPAILAALNMPAVDLKLAWPLDYSFFYGYNLDGLAVRGVIGWAFLAWGIALAFIVVPAMAVFFGKRWYCSWVCGCGGLAETLGDPFRHQSDKSLKAWKVERWLVHGVLVFAVAMTAIVMVNYFTNMLGTFTWRVQSWYGFLIGSMFAGVVGTGFYPLMGNRVWCRFGCPLAAILGIVQKYKSRFRITTNGAQCISCGNCSTYCEMGIDVRWYAQRGQNVVRASCVGCGVCAAVCPRGVLRLENGPEAGRYNTESLVQIRSGIDRC